MKHAGVPEAAMSTTQHTPVHQVDSHNSPTRDADRKERMLWGGMLLLLLLVLILRNAWVTEDAYIMFRTVDNFVHGHGLTWNISERVQTFTNPLWTLLLSGIHLITGDLFYTSIFMGVLCTMAAVIILVRRIAVSWAAMLCALVPLICSKAFIDFATSGLENPFTFLALAIFFSFYYRDRPIRPSRYFLALSLITGLALLNRMDTLLLFAPTLAFEFFRLKGWRHLGMILLGMVPFLFWELFSIFYYGFPFPNTAYAKLNTGIPVAERMEQGWNYLINSLALDPVTLMAMVIGIGVAVAGRDRRGIPLAIGVLLYVAYTIRVGGDFMSGRFMAAPLFAAMIGVAAHLPRMVERAHVGAYVLIFGVISLGNERSPLRTGPNYFLEYDENVDRFGIADERAFYFHQFGLPNYNGEDQVEHGYLDMVDTALATLDKEPVPQFGNIGVIGYHIGPDVHVLDICALADPLLARLPAAPWSRVGHFVRDVPNGYAETLATGENRLVHPKLATYYDALAQVIKGPLFSSDRFREIWRLNTGHYDHLLNAYHHSRYMVVLPLHDLLAERVYEQHRHGHWTELEDGIAWGLYSECHLVLHCTEETTGQLRFTVDHPFKEQPVEVYVHGELRAADTLGQGVIWSETIPIQLKAEENWITFKYRSHVNLEEPEIENETRPLGLRFTELGVDLDP